MANPTTNLSITLPTVGGSSNSWGTTLNDAFQSLDDIFVSGGTGVSINIDGGTVDGAVVGGVTPAAVTGTLITANTAVRSDGTVSAPAFSFVSDTDMGWYYIAAGNAGFAVGGSKVLDVTASGFSVTGTVTASGALSCAALTSSGAITHTGSTAGFFSATPVAQQTPPDPLVLTGTYATDEQAIEDAVNAIRTALRNLGLCS